MNPHATTYAGKAIAEGQAVPLKPRIPDRSPLTIGRAFERFSELPAVFVIVVLWMMGVALFASSALVLSLVARVLGGLVAGPI